jgi:hypothetical protein
MKGRAIQEGVIRYQDGEDREITIVDESSKGNIASLRDLNAMNINEDPL